MEEAFAEFCYKSSIKGIYAFTAQGFYDTVKGMEVSGKEVDGQAFLSDLHERASMFVLEKRTIYIFVHRNFQQYYAAWHMCNHPDDIGDYYYKLKLCRWVDTDEQISIMLDINRSAVEKHLFLPYLRDILSLGYLGFINCINPGVRLEAYKEKVNELKLTPIDASRPFTDLYGYIMSAVGLKIQYQTISGNFEVKGLSGSETYIDIEDGFTLDRKAAEVINRRFKVEKCKYVYDEYSVFYRDLVNTGNDEILKCINEDGRIIFRLQYNRFRDYYEELKARYPSR